MHKPVIMSHNNSTGRRAPSETGEAGGFTLVELLVVIGVLSLLAVTMLPALAANRSGSQAFQCLNNHRQLVAGWLTYAAENGDRLSITRPVAGLMSWSANPDNIDKELLVTYQDSNGFIVSPLARYISIPDVWKCPADTVSAPNGSRVRSVAMNGPLVGATTFVVNSGYPTNRQYLNRVLYMSQLRSPADVFVSMDEHPDSINDSSFMVNPAQSPGSYSWRDLPASYHNGAAGFSAADGRAEMHRWLEDSTKQPIVKVSKPWGSQLVVPNSVDVEWMNNMMPYRKL